MAELGEFRLVERIRRLAERVQGRDVVLGIGDDAALLRGRSDADVVLSVDTLVEDVHFRWSTHSPRSIGRRALAVNLSDLAAMGARPTAALLSLVVPPSLSTERALGLVRGLLEEGDRYDCPLAGGNVARGSQTSLAVTVVGRVARGGALRRDAARPGDRLLVTGTLGGAALALARAERGGAKLRQVPTPRLEAGVRLAKLRGVGACIDVSDGLAADLRHLLRASGVGARVDAESVPRPRRFARDCAALGLDASALAWSGGEDYELLFSVRPDAPSATALARRLTVRVTEIGALTQKRHGLVGIPRDARDGFRHF